MKTTHFFKFLTAIAVIVGFTLSSCKKDKKEEEPDKDTTAASDNSYIENLSNDIDNIGDQAGNSQTGSSLTTYKLVNPQNSILSNCATITVFRADSLNADSILVDFGTSNCVGNDGKIRNGQLLYTYSGGKHYRDSGIVITCTPISYNVEGNQVSGNRTITNKGRLNGNFNWEISANITVVKANNGGTVTWTCNRTKVLLNTSTVYSGPSNPINWPQAKIGILGSASGTTAAGNSYTVTITHQLIRDFTCSPSSTQPHRHPFIQGKMEFAPSGKPIRYVDFGPGTCDLNATVTINGISHPIIL